MMTTRRLGKSMLVAAVLALAASSRCGEEFTRGDTNGDGRVDIADGVETFGFLFGLKSIPCLDAADANDDGRITVEDAFFVGRLLFQGGTKCPPPFPNDGLDPTADPLTCLTAAEPFDAPLDPTFVLRLDSVDVPASGDSASVVLSMDATSLYGPTSPQTFSAAIRYPAAELEVTSIESLVQGINLLMGVGRIEDEALTINGFPPFTPQSPIPMIPLGPVARLSFTLRQPHSSATFPLSFDAHGGQNPRYVYTGVGMDGIFIPCEGIGASIIFGSGDPFFRRGDTNADGGINIADVVFILSYLFSSDDRLTCTKSADTNDSGKVDIADAVFALGYLFAQGTKPPAPFDSCGADLTPDDLPCASFAACGR